MKGLLVLEDGTVYRGDAIGRPGTSFGEIVFNTAMSGYQEVLTDPSYSGQIVVMTAAHVGNYGIRADEAESDRVHVAGFVARDFPVRWSGTGGEQSLADYLDANAVTGLHGLDTRSLVRRIRSLGAMRAGVSTEIEDPAELHRRVLESPAMVGNALALTVSPGATRVAPGGRGRKKHRVAAVDYGMKRNIVRLLQAGSCCHTLESIQFGYNQDSMPGRGGYLRCVPGYTHSNHTLVPAPNAQPGPANSDAYTGCTANCTHLAAGS